ncbi:sodiumchloride-dependent and chloride-dependent taurine transporter-like [Octopus vulgaris]|uniref:Transporter n=1 Tax=Octopus vulgaris TaxID=6645 RepID=A0AA36AF91_OCTVU|nr:sodiumchloride-dependent and chloride-dependent taurine transporter-like [Octopus vulgaris]
MSNDPTDDKTDVDKTDEDGDLNKREKWSRNIDFLLACIGFSVGLGNVWRFPYLCYRNGGGAFLIPYFICVIIGGVPLFFLEVAVGQFTGTTGLKAWRLCPILQGIGLTSFVIVVFLNIYYNVILCWSFRYMFASFTTGTLPWAKCGQEWNTCACRSVSDGYAAPNDTLCNITLDGNSTSVKTFDSVTEYWEREVLQISSGLEDMGVLKWDLVLCLLFAWIVVYICICKGIKSSGKVMYVTATSPYIFMLILLIRGSLLPGAKEGIIFYLKPNFERLKDIQVWVDAGSQIFFSYSISLGALTALGSYNVFNHNCFRDSIIFSITNSGTSLLAGFITFPVLGYMANKMNKTIDDVAESGPGMAFIAYPQAVATMPGAPFWSILFFLMLILLGMDSQFVGVEAVVTLIVDQFPKQLRRGYRKEIFTGCVCIASFFFGLPMCMNGGMYVFQIFDFYAASRIILLVGGLECIAIAWIYGVNRFYDNIEMMVGYKIGPFMKVSWLITSPVFCLTIFIMSVVNYTELTYKRPSGTYVYPDWAVGIGWTMALVSAIFIPIVALVLVLKQSNAKAGLKALLEPKGLKSHQLRPQDFDKCASYDLESFPNKPPSYVFAISHPENKEA